MLLRDFTVIQATVLPRRLHLLRMKPRNNQWLYPWIFSVSNRDADVFYK